MTSEGTIIRARIAAAPDGLIVSVDVLFDGCAPALGYDASHGLLALLPDPTAGADLYALTARLLGEQAAAGGTTLAALAGRRVRANVDAQSTYVDLNTVEVLPAPAPVADAPARTVLQWRPIADLPDNWRDPEASHESMVFVWDYGIYNGWPLPASLNGSDDGTVWETDEHAHKLGGVRWWAYCPLDALPPSTALTVPAHFLR